MDLMLKLISLTTKISAFLVQEYITQKGVLQYYIATAEEKPMSNL